MSIWHHGCFSSLQSSHFGSHFHSCALGGVSATGAGGDVCLISTSAHVTGPGSALAVFFQTTTDGPADPELHVHLLWLTFISLIEIKIRMEECTMCGRNYTRCSHLIQRSSSPPRLGFGHTYRDCFWFMWTWCQIRVLLSVLRRAAGASELSGLSKVTSGRETWFHSSKMAVLSGWTSVGKEGWDEERRKREERCGFV